MHVRTYINWSIDVLWGQPIKLAQVASTSELNENQWNDLLFFEIVVISAGPRKYKHKIGHNYFTFQHPKKSEAFFIIEIRVIFAVNKILKI